MGRPNTADAERLFAAVYGSVTGYTNVSHCLFEPGTKKKAGEWNNGKFYPIPQALGFAIDAAFRLDAAGEDVYLAAQLHTGKSRTAATAADIACLYNDTDGGAVPDHLRPSARVRSSASRYQDYWRLTRPIPPDQALALGKRLASACRTDISGVGLEQVLRLPGTMNRTHRAEGEIVVLEWLEEDRRYDPDELDRILPPLPAEPKAAAVVIEDDGDDSPPVVLDAEGLASYRGGRPVLKASGVIDNSRSLVEQLRVLYDAGATKRIILAEAPVLDARHWQKYTSRRDAAKMYLGIWTTLAKKPRKGISRAQPPADDEPPPDPFDQAERIALLEHDLEETRAKLARTEHYNETLLRELSTANEVIKGCEVILSSPIHDQQMKAPYCRLLIARAYDPRFKHVDSEAVPIWIDQIAEMNGGADDKTVRKWLQTMEAENLGTLTHLPGPKRPLPNGRTYETKRLALQIGPRPGEAAMSLTDYKRLMCSPTGPARRKERKKPEPIVCPKGAEDELRREWYCTVHGDHVGTDYHQPRHQAPNQRKHSLAMGVKEGKLSPAEIVAAPPNVTAFADRRKVSADSAATPTAPFERDLQRAQQEYLAELAAGGEV